jgi:hypothetical protein
MFKIKSPLYLEEKLRKEFSDLIKPLLDRMKEISEEFKDNRYFKLWWDHHYAFRSMYPDTGSGTKPDFVFEYKGKKYPFLTSDVIPITESNKNIMARRGKLEKEKYLEMEIFNGHKRAKEFYKLDNRVTELMREYSKNRNKMMLNLKIKKKKKSVSQKVNKKKLWTQNKSEFAQKIADTYTGNPGEYKNLKDATRKIYALYTFSPQWNIKRCYSLVLKKH